MQLHKAVVTITRPCMPQDTPKILALWVIMGERPLTVDIHYRSLRILHDRGVTVSEAEDRDINEGAGRTLAVAAARAGRNHPRGRVDCGMNAGVGIPIA
jgi:hypothetical protein